ncbi:hypothetical protein [Paenibacillus sp. P46E]|uniref:hypothetical protein n=1 Tax=Paenibacillus sp. P46E TaxID=1349436 RepID=UPI00093BF988|nr:hypothetical protein [Paenibacillus sp. P46E]OKQ00050.1 hypothetical protein A3849_02350 [Paenibacillus sp. P46E]
MIEHAELNISAVQFIDLQRIEIYWNDDAEGANDPQSFSVELNGVKLPLCYNDDPEAWDTRCVYEKSKRRTTLSLQNPIQFSDLGKVTLSVIGPTRHHSYPIKNLEHFYTRFTRTTSGILIKSSARVDYAVHEKACEMIEIMLCKRPEVAEKMVEHHAALAIYGLQEDAYDIPEHRGGTDFLQYPVEGFGGTPTIPVTSVSEKNVMRYVEGPAQTKYKNESIVAHEFGHAVHLIGINNLEDQTLAKQLVDAYENAASNNLWPGTYAISNYEEYFATLTAIWFNVMAESSDGTWDGVRGPVNTREELKAYDPVGYAFFESIYPDRSFPEPWSSTPNNFPVPLA